MIFRDINFTSQNRLHFKCYTRTFWFMKHTNHEDIRRRTVMIDADNMAKLQMLQAHLIEKTNSTVSFSFVVQEMLRRYFHIG